MTQEFEGILSNQRADESSSDGSSDSISSDSQRGSLCRPASTTEVAVTMRNVRKGMVVQRGADWKWEQQDGGPGKLGLLEAKSDVTDGWARVKWDSGTTNSYRIGADGGYDLKVGYVMPYSWHVIHMI